MRYIRTRTRVLFLLGILLCLPAAGCGDIFDNSSTTNATGTTASTKVTLSGTVSETLAKPQLKKPNGIGVGALHSAMTGGEVKVIDSKGGVVGTATIAADGTYSASVDKGANYIVKATKGNVCLKSYVEKADADKTVTVDPASSAVVKVLGKKIGNDKLGDEGEDVSNIISSSDVASIIVAINNSGLLATIASAIQADISANADYTSTTVTVGVVSTAGDDDAATIALNITITITVAVQGGAPSAPTGVTATAGDGQVTVTWNAVTGATSYNLYYSGTTGVAGIKINGITTGTSYTLTGLTNGTTYHFIVTASNDGAESAGSSQVSGTPQIPAPGAPTGLTAIANMEKVTLSWSAVNSATSYNVYYRTVTGVTPANGTKVANAASDGDIAGLTGDTTYYFVVTAVNAGGESVISSEISATPYIKGKWSTITTMPTPRSFMAVQVVNGIIYTMGGNVADATYGNTWTTKVEAYDTASNAWTTKASMPELRQYPASAEVNGIIYVMGGCCEAMTGNSSTTVQAYDTATNTWTTIAPMPAARAMFSAVVVNGIIYTIGGQNPWVGNVSYTNKVDAYNPLTNTWISKKDTTTGFTNVCTAHDGIIYIIDEMWPLLRAYDTVTELTTQKASMLHSRIHSTAATYNGIIYAISGTKYTHSPNEVYWSGGWGSTFPSVEAYDPATDRWTDRPDIPTPRYGASSIVLNGAIYVVGGSTYNPFSFVANVDVYQE